MPLTRLEGLLHQHIKFSGMFKSSWFTTRSSWHNPLCYIGAKSRDGVMWWMEWHYRMTSWVDSWSDVVAWREILFISTLCRRKTRWTSSSTRRFRYTKRVRRTAIQPTGVKCLGNLTRILERHAHCHVLVATRQRNQVSFSHLQNRRGTHAWDVSSPPNCNGFWGPGTFQHAMYFHRGRVAGTPPSVRGCSGYLSLNYDICSLKLLNRSGRCPTFGHWTSVDIACHERQHKHKECCRGQLCEIHLCSI